jgi:hypothetical protein
MQSKQNPKKSSFSANLQSSDVMLFPRDISYDYAGDKKKFYGSEITETHSFVK